MSGRITVEIDSSSLEEILARLTVAEARSQRMAGAEGSAAFIFRQRIDTSKVVEPWVIDPDEQAEVDRLLGKKPSTALDFPGMSRAERYLLAQIIGPQPLQYYSMARQLKAGISGLQVGGAAATGGVLTIAMVSVMIAMEVASYVQRMQQERSAYLGIIAGLQPGLKKDQLDKWYNDNTDWLRRFITG